MSLTPRSKSFADLFTASGGADGYVMGPGGLYVPQAAPAFEYDPDSHAQLGLRFRGVQATNLITTSRPGVPSATYITTTDANGVITGQAARKWLRTGTNPDVALTAIPGATGIPGSDQTITFWAIFEQDPASPDTSTLLNFYRTAPSAQSRFYAALNLDTGVFTVGVNLVSATYSTALLQAAGPNGGKVWFVRMTAAVANGETWSVLVYPCRGVTGASAIVGQSMFAHHFQLEAGAVGHQSPIVTTGIAVTRTPDAIAILDLPSRPWWSPDEGTVLIEFTKVGAANTTTSERVLAISSSTNERILVFLNYLTGQLAWLLTTGGTERFRVNLGASPVHGESTRLVISFRANRYIACRNAGSANITTGSLPIPSGATNLNLGHEPTVSGGLSGHIKTLRYWPKAANANEIASITPDTAVIQG